ncbi:MAG: zonular occludens toxin domain-containing protein [Stenotrophomonas sp.]
MLYLITGQNGAGKSLRAIWKMYQLHGQGMEVYAYGFRGLRAPFVKPFEDPRKWETLPPNSALFIDEAQNVWRTRSGGRPVPPEILALETHRHQGIDLYLITQSPMYLDSHIRPLIKDHEHLVSFDSKSARVFRFSECQEDVKSSKLRSNAEFAVWQYPTQHYADYDSADVHTKKRAAPWRHRIGKALIGLAILLILGSVVWLFLPSGDPKAKAPAAAASASSSLLGGFATGPAKRGYAHAQEYVQAHMPRVAELPWSMPAMDERGVQAQPEVYCMSSGEGRGRSCTCLTEQGTRYRLDLARCERIARYGPAYNPYKAPRTQVAQAVTQPADKGHDRLSDGGGEFRIMYIM